MNIEEIMKPYYEKQEEIKERNSQMDENVERQVATVNALKIRLERLRNNKDREIAEYIQNATLENENFYSGYGALIRKDLEKEYDRKEKELMEELDKQMKISVNNSNKYHRVDVRELVEVKNELRKKLIPAKQELETKLKQVTLDFDAIMLKLSTFKYEYDENNNVTNGNEYRKLFEESNRLIETKYNLQSQLKKIEENIKFTELTMDEVKVIMMSMTPWEKEEYDRRKSLIVVEDIASEEMTTEEPTTQLSDEQMEVEPVAETAEEPLLEQKKEENVSETEELIQDEIVVLESGEELMNMIYEDIVNSAQKLNIVKLDSTKSLESREEDYVELNDDVQIQLPNGSYVNKKDISNALNNYVKQNKGRKFKVNGIDKTLEVTKNSLRQIKKSLKECSTIKLLREKKLGFFDIKRVFGIETAENYSKKVEIGRVKTNIPTGDYVNLQEFYMNLKNLFSEKKQSWLVKFADKLMGNNNSELVEEKQKTI